jgi:polyphosphate kinase 2 (PPK2 family)
LFEVVDLTRELAKDEYKKRISHLQGRLWELQRAAWRSSVPTVIVFEGWDAAGKGDCIRKLTERLEPRGFDLHHVTDQPRTHETELPWMWRFWTSIPPRGSMAIFDRSWNRRAAIEHLNNPDDEMEWRRKLRDIGDFERWMAHDGYVLIKLFLHISHEEQLRRYDLWKEDPGMSWKALEGSWQKPKDFDKHIIIAEELLQHTETGWSPWEIIAATDIRWARVRVFETIIHRMENALETRGIEVEERKPQEDENNNGDPD